MREIAIIINEDEEKKVFVHDLFSFSIKYHNQSSRRNTIPESEKIIITLSTTGIWLIDEDELLIEEDGEWWDKSDELSFFLRWQNPDSINSPLTLKMLFYSIVESIIQDRHRSCGYGHSIRIEDIGRSYSENAIREKRKEIEKVILEVLTDEFTKIDNTSSNPHANASDERMKKTPEAAERLSALKPKGSTTIDPRLEAIERREKEWYDPSTAIGRKHLARKSWKDLPNKVRSLILHKYEMSESDVKKYWDGSDYIMREDYILK